MKKIKKIILGIIVILFILFLGIRIYHYSILSKISETTEILESSFAPYFIKVTTINPDGSCYVDENYREGNVAVSINKTKQKDKYVEDSKSWRFLDEKFCNEYHASYIEEESTLICVVQNEDRIKEEFKNVFINFWSYKFPNLEFETDITFLDKIRIELQSTILYPAVKTEEYKGEKCYAFNPFGRDSYMKMYIDKETYLPVAIKSWGQDRSELYIREFEYLTEAPEGVYDKPKLEDFDNVVFNDYGNNDVNMNSNLKLIAEKPISGTNLKAGEMLIENVEIKENEELNFLKLTPNESGIINFEIYNIETYNKFREKYSGLRELTEEDFEAYYATIAYKPGEKLNYLNCLESKEIWKFNFAVNAEKSNNESIFFAIIPNETRNRQTGFVESDEKIKIDAENAINISEENIEEIGKYFELDFESYLGYKNDYLELLTKEEFAELEYIKTPIAGEERVCWNIQYRVSEHETINYIELYVDAISGKLIGAKKYYK